MTCLKQSVEWLAGTTEWLEENLPNAPLSTTNPAWPDLDSNPDRRGGKLPTKYKPEVNQKGRKWEVFYTVTPGKILYKVAGTESEGLRKIINQLPYVLQGPTLEVYTHTNTHTHTHTHKAHSHTYNICMYKYTL
jgi:hypothetical protein